MPFGCILVKIKTKNTMNLDANYWNQRYLEQKTGWDIGFPSTPLVKYIEQVRDKNVEILIPGCGNAYEAIFLAQKGFRHITILDIAPKLVQDLQERCKLYPQIEVLHQDFFLHQGKYDLIIEQTFFCAINPELRSNYAKKMWDLLKSGGKLVGVLFNKHFEVSPPFGGNAEEYRNYFSPYFTFQTFDNCYNSIAPRMGSELFMILQKKAFE
ncbi:MAG: methyltransferase domain-containing protein [Raineya sp.]